MIAGLLGGLLGVGGGFVMIPLQVVWGRVAPHNASANSLIGVVSISVIGSLFYYYNSPGHLDVRFAILLGIGGVIGAYLGARFARRVPEQLLLSAMAIALAAIGIKELIAP